MQEQDELRALPEMRCGGASGREPTGLGEDAALNALAQDCFSGDMQACDDLFDSAPIGSPYMAYGNTCAGRQEPHTFNYCRVVFGTG